MRLIHTFDNDKHGLACHVFLTENGVENQLEVHSDNDWGSSEYGVCVAHIWIYSEDDFEKAQGLMEKFLKNPDDPRYYHEPNTEIEEPEIVVEQPKEEKKENHTHKLKNRRKMGVVTLYLILFCTMLFLFGSNPARNFKPPPKGIPYTPLFASPIKKMMLFDYPKAYIYLDDLIKTFGSDSLQDPQLLPKEGQQLFIKFRQTPVWDGFYEKVLNFFKEGNPIKVTAPMFEKIKKGEVWRLFTPALLHNDLFHLFFNMIWLLVIGKQIESRIGIPKYLLFILLTGVFSNISQYLMSGANFIGFSGVLCGMIMFVWTRQKRTPWEGYQLMPATMAFISIFVVAMFGLQLLSFLLETGGYGSIAPPIANTAHLSGAFMGWMLGRMPFFKRIP